MKKHDKEITSKKCLLGHGKAVILTSKITYEKKPQLNVLVKTSTLISGYLFVGLIKGTKEETLHESLKSCIV
jgi:hypothetical protein